MFIVLKVVLTVKFNSCTSVNTVQCTLPLENLRIGRNFNVMKLDCTARLYLFDTVKYILKIKFSAAVMFSVSHDHSKNISIINIA